MIKKILLNNLELNHHMYESLTVFLYDDGSILLLPTLFSMSIQKRRKIFRPKIVEDDNGILTEELIETRVEVTTINTIISKLYTYLSWVANIEQDKTRLNLSTHHNFPDTAINDYINATLIGERSKGSTSIDQSIMALNAYYRWLAYAQLTTTKTIEVEPDNVAVARGNTNRKTAIEYYSPRLRSEFYRRAPNRLTECVLRAGGQMGIRSCENRGFLLKDFKYGGKTHKGLSSLFKEMEDDPDQNAFEYFLQGTFSKAKPNQGGESRTLTFKRETLECFKAYYDQERPTHHRVKKDGKTVQGVEISESAFFLKGANNGYGKPIPACFGTDKFTDLKNKLLTIQKNGKLLDSNLQLIEQDHRYHILRHSAGTDELHELADEQNIFIDDITTTSSPMIEVARMLGHSLKGIHGPQITSTYIHRIHQKITLENY
jgi:hypothetical protein